jgi:hypothetical protein
MKKMKINGYEIKPGADLSGANLRYADLRYADLSGANLYYANLSGADLSGAILRRVNLSDAYLSGADLSGAILSGADLRYANLRRANLRGANLRYADLSGANLSGADLRYANLYGANLYGADLSGVDLSGANLSGANLRRVNLSGAKGLLNPADWLAANFKTNKKGYIVYKAEGQTTYTPALHWKGSKFITEVVNPNRTDTCGCGVNFATLKWIKSFYPGRIRNGTIKIRRMYLHWKDLPSVVVPYNTDGKARCGRLEKGRLI